MTRREPHLGVSTATSRAGAPHRVRELGLTWADYMVLAITNALDGPSQEAISNRVGIDRGSLSRLVRDLEDEGLIDCLRGHTDGRRVLCLATPAGRAATAEAAEVVDDASRTTLRRLHARERARLHVLMARAIGARDRATELGRARRA